MADPRFFALSGPFTLDRLAELTGASLDNGLLHIELKRPVPASRVRAIKIAQGNGAAKPQTIDVAPDAGHTPEQE